MKNLKETAKAVKSAETFESKAAYLDQAFELFKQETERLAGAYWNLQQKFETVSSELQQSSKQLKEKVSELNLTNRYLDSILNQMSQGLLFINLTGSITTYNKRAALILGVESDRVLFQSYSSLFPDDLLGFSLKQALTEKIAPETTYVTIKGLDDAYREVEINVNFNIQEGVQGIILLLRDITDLRRLQTLAARNDRLKELGEMAALVAHEIRNPLGGIKGFASLLERDLKNNPELSKMAGYIIEGTDALNRLVGKVLNYSRPIQLKLESTNLTILMFELIEHVQADQNVNPNIILRVQATNPEILVPADPSILKGAILNLVVNSIQAMPDGGNLTIFVSAENQWAIIQVVDTGEGIAPENINKVFSPFFTTRQDGNGFGLAEVYKVVQAHGGLIEVTSTLGKGTTFTVKLPLQIGTKYGN